MALSFAFDTSKGETPESIKRRRDIARALMNIAPADTIGGGIANLGQGIAAAVLNARANAAERAGMEGADAAWASIAPTFPAAPGGSGSASYRDAIAGIESGGRYEAMGPVTKTGDRAYGKYQIMGANVGPWTKQVLGAEMTARDFLANPEAQDKVFDSIFGGYVDKYGPEGAAQAWFGGPGSVGKAGRKDVLGTSVGEYGQRFVKALGGSPAKAEIAKALEQSPTQVASIDPAAGARRALVEQGVNPDSPVAQAAIDLKKANPEPKAQIAQALDSQNSMTLGSPPIQPGSGPSMETLMEAAGNPFMTDTRQAIIQELMKKRMQEQDPAYQMDIEKRRLELDALRNPRMSPSEKANYDLNVKKFGAEEADRMRQAELDASRLTLDQGKAADEKTDRAADNAREDARLKIEQDKFDMSQLPDYYDAYVKQETAAGRTPLGIKDYVVELKKSGASNTSVTVGGEPPDGALRKKLDEKTGENWAGLSELGTTSASMAQDMQVLDELIKVAPQGPVTGRLAELFPGVSSAGAAFESVVKRVAPTLRAPGSGSTSDIEYDGMLQSLPALRNNPEANTAISAVMKAKAALNIERADVIAAYQNGDISAGYARNKIAEINKRSIMTPELKKMLGGLGEANQPTDAQQAPAGVDPGLWEHMTPEERALWAK